MGKVHAAVLEKEVRAVIELQIREKQRPALYSLKGSRVVLGVQPVHICFCGLGLVWTVCGEVLQEYEVLAPMLWTVQSLYKRRTALVHITGSKLLLFRELDFVRTALYH